MESAFKYDLNAFLFATAMAIQGDHEAVLETVRSW